MNELFKVFNFKIVEITYSTIVFEETNTKGLIGFDLVGNIVTIGEEGNECYNTNDVLIYLEALKDDLNYEQL